MPYPTFLPQGTSFFCSYAQSTLPNSWYKQTIVPSNPRASRLPSLERASNAPCIKREHLMHLWDALLSLAEVLCACVLLCVCPECFERQDCDLKPLCIKAPQQQTCIEWSTHIGGISQCMFVVSYRDMSVPKHWSTLKMWLFVQYAQESPIFNASNHLETFPDIAWCNLVFKGPS